jgi:Transglutaminase-like superfamily
MKLTRRVVIIGATAAMGFFSKSTAARHTMTNDPAAWLHATHYIDATHRAIADLAARLTAGHAGDRAKALAIFEFVRSDIRFGFARGFWDVSASKVLSLGIGYCNTKSTLFVALLRAAGVPARQVFVDIHASVLYGILNPGSEYVDHSYVEVFLSGSWIATDAYIVDPSLFKAAQRRVKAEGRLMGYSVHATASNIWDGMTPAFSQFNILDPRPISSHRWGVYEDVGDFYARADNTRNKLNSLLRLAMGAIATEANQQADMLRAAG